MIVERATIRRRGRGGFTLVELLVVIAIIGVLTALLLPAVQAARESARRLQCASNMRNIGLAVLEYESARHELPPSGLARKQTDATYRVDLFNPFGGVQLSWLVLILPQLEQAALYDQFNLTKPLYSQSIEARTAVVEVLLCPSDAGRERRHNMLKPGLGVTYSQLAKGNYAAYTSPFHVDLQYLYPGALVGDPQPLRMIADLSATLAVSEVRTLDHAADERGAWALAWNGASLLALDMHPDNVPEVKDGTGVHDPYLTENRAPYSPSSDSAGEAQPPNNQGPNFDTLKYCTDVPASNRQQAFDERMPCLLHSAEIGVGVHGHMSSAPRSLHPGGVNAAYLDAHVAFVVDEVDVFAMAHMVSVTD